jgi:hypothetical protein
LAAQEEILSCDRLPGSNRKPRQPDEVAEQQQNDPSEGDHACIMPLQLGARST